MPNDFQVTKEAEELFSQLKIGTNIADPSSNIGSFAFSSHAIAFLNNAVALCKNDNVSDFRVYGALYFLRHGIELMLKCLARNQMIDVTLSVLMTPHQSFEVSCNKLHLKNKQKIILMHSLCVIRNVLKAKIIRPKCYNVNIDDDFANDALEYLRQNPNIPREIFAATWASSSFGHELVELWGKAEPIINDIIIGARRYAIEVGYKPPLSASELKPLIDLLASLDDGGDGFRYPSSIDGGWYTISVQGLSLEALQALINKIENTCLVFLDFRENRYSQSTIGQPYPFYPQGSA